MAEVALALFVAYFAVAFGLRTWLQYRRTGDAGFRGISGRPGSAEWWGGVLFVLALVAGVGGPVSDLLGMDPVDALVSPWVQPAGVVLTLVGIAATFAAQVAMGTSWRIGVDDHESTELVTGGAFAVVRNPIFTAMGVTAVGLLLIVPNVVAIAGLVVLCVAVQMQIRVVEEPYLRRLHGTRWDEYAARVGRFVPRLGTIRPADPSHTQTG